MGNSKFIIKPVDREVYFSGQSEVPRNLNKGETVVKMHTHNIWLSKLTDDVDFFDSKKEAESAIIELAKIETDFVYFEIKEVFLAKREKATLAKSKTLAKDNEKKED